VLSPDHCACFALVENTDDLGSKFELPTFGSDGQEFEHLNCPVSINESHRVQLWDTGYLDSPLCGIEVCDFLIVELEYWDGSEQRCFSLSRPGQEEQHAGYAPKPRGKVGKVEN
jgi:hypothetical protein